MQRERDFDQYQDDGVFYDRRPSVLGRAEGQLGEGRGHAGRDSDRRRDLRQHRRVLESGGEAAAGPGAAVRLPPVLVPRQPGVVPARAGARHAHRASAASSARSAPISPGASWSISPAATSPLLGENANVVPVISRLTRRSRNHLGPAVALDQRLARDVRSQPHRREHGADQPAAVPGGGRPGADGDLALPVHAAAGRTSARSRAGAGTGVARNCGSTRRRIRCT